MSLADKLRDHHGWVAWLLGLVLSALVGVALFAFSAGSTVTGFESRMGAVEVVAAGLAETIREASKKAESASGSLTHRVSALERELPTQMGELKAVVGELKGLVLYLTGGAERPREPSDAALRQGEAP